MTEFAELVHWLGTLSGFLGVSIAVYLQLINPRHCHGGYVSAIFLAGSAVILVFSPAWSNGGTTILLKLIAAFLFGIAEIVAGYHVWKAGHVAPAREVVKSLFKVGDENGGSA